MMYIFIFLMLLALTFTMRMRHHRVNVYRAKKMAPRLNGVVLPAKFTPAHGVKQLHP